MRAAFTLNSTAEAKLRQAIARKVGSVAKRVMFALHTKILDATAVNSGKTLASWAASAGAPRKVNAPYEYDWATTPRTNNLSVGMEPGRATFTQISLATQNAIDYEKNPYRKFMISNYATLDSGVGIPFPVSSDLPDWPGARAYYQEYGLIADYGILEDQGKGYFSPRSVGAIRNAVASFRLDLRSKNF